MAGKVSLIFPIVGSLLVKGQDFPVTWELEQASCGDLSSWPDHPRPHWSPWSPWSTCSATCEFGQRARTRTCSQTAECVGSGEETEPCYAGKCPVDGIWGEWGPWTACEPNVCETGESLKEIDTFQSRNRSCDAPEAANGGQDCDESKSLQNITCPTRATICLGTSESNFLPAAPAQINSRRELLL